MTEITTQELKPFYVTHVAAFHEFYLSGEILEPAAYIEWFNIIRNARGTDEIVIYINSGGGNLDTALQFLRVMSESDARITASAEGACMSAATMIFLAADSNEVTDHCLFMFHNYSAGTFGKGGEMYDQLKFERSWSEKLLKSIYKYFLTDKEIEEILNNKDIWMDSEEVAMRLRYRMEATAKEETPAVE